MRTPFSRLEFPDFPLLVVLSLLFFVLVLAAVVREERDEWRPIQEQFRSALEHNGQSAAARGFKVGIRQLWLPELGRVDRCVTCHLGYEWSGVLPASLPQPLAPHPDLPYMDAHPFNEFGCTSCHGGQGFATTTEAAHGQVAHWEEPLLDGALAAGYGLSPTELMQIRCNGCHRHADSTPGMETIDHGKTLVRKNKCLVCHTIEGRGGLKAPDLTFVGDKNPELFDFSNVEGPHTAFNWHVQHLTHAGTVVPHTTMPDFDFPPEDARALTLLLLSWRRLSMPPRYIPRPVPAPTEAAPRQPAPVPEVAGAEAGRTVFLERGCASCHGVGTGTQIGPDLKYVGRRHDAEWLRRWLTDPAAMLRAYPDLASWPAAYGNIVMPNQNLTGAEIDALVTYLGKL
ncbi:MAG TPA: cytochrome c [Candidatus Binatia bacterium]